MLLIIIERKIPEKFQKGVCVWNFHIILVTV